MKDHGRQGPAALDGRGEPEPLSDGEQVHSPRVGDHGDDGVVDDREDERLPASGVGLNAGAAADPGRSLPVLAQLHRLLKELADRRTRKSAEGQGN